MVMHNGYGYFMGAEMVKWGHNRQRYTEEERVAIRKQMQAGTRNEEEDKQQIRIGGLKEREIFTQENKDVWVPEDLGLVLVSCERGDMRHGPQGLLVYDDDGSREIDLQIDRKMGPGYRRAELEELYDAVVEGHPIFHTGEWGMATLEVVLGIMESGKEHRDIPMQHQVPVHERYSEAKTFSGVAI